MLPMVHFEMKYDNKNENKRLFTLQRTDLSMYLLSDILICYEFILHSEFCISENIEADCYFSIYCSQNDTQ
jgi:hypothetical protein